MTLMTMMCLGIVANADPNVTLTQPTRKLIHAPGQPIRIVLSDGREAEIRYMTTTPVLIDSPVSIDENDCSPFYGPVCHYEFGARLVRVAPVWTKHPNPELIHKVVKYGQRNKATGKIESFRELEFNIPVLPPTQKLESSSVFSGMTEEKLTCSDFRWMPDTGKQAPLRTQILKVSNENNGMNPETRLNENRISFDLFDVQVTRQSSSIVIFGVRAGALGAIANPPIFIFPSVSLAFQKKDGSTCLVGTSNSVLGNLTGRLFGSEESGAPLDGAKMKTFNVDDSQQLWNTTDIGESLNQDIFNNWYTPDPQYQNNTSFGDYE